MAIMYIFADEKYI